MKPSEMIQYMLKDKGLREEVIIETDKTGSPPELTFLISLLVAILDDMDSRLKALEGNAISKLKESV